MIFAIVQSGSEFTTSIDVSITSARDSLLAETALLGAPANDAEAAEIAGKIGEIKRMVADVEEARKLATEPFLQAQRDIMAKAKAFCAEPMAEVSRLDILNRDYLVEKAKRQKAAEDARRREVERIERERREAELAAQREREAAERKAREEREAIERKSRQEAEDARRAEMAAANEAERVAAQHRAAEAARIAEEARRAAEAKAEEERKAAEAREAEAKQQADLFASARTMALPEVREEAKVEGTKTRPVIRWEIVHSQRFAVAHPDCVDITPRKATIQQHIAAGRFTLANPPAGLRMWEEFEVVTATARKPRKMIEA